MSELANQCFERALTAIRGRDHGTADLLLQDALKLKPDFAEAWVVRGNVLHAEKRHFDSALNYEKALNINDQMHDAHSNLGLAFADIGLFKAAEMEFRRAIELFPSMAPHMGLANMFCTIMRLQDAETEYRAACACDDDTHEAHFNLGITLLGLGRWAEAFPEYEWRWKNTPYPPLAYRKYVRWRGEDLAGKRIVLYPEQGYGDEIMGLRFVNAVAERYPDAAVLVQVRSPMYRLVRGSFEQNISVVDMHAGDGGLGGIPVDFSCPLLDVPGVLGMGWATVPRPRSYLKASAVEVAEWRERLAAYSASGAINVGLCWSSGSHLDTARDAMAAKSVRLPWLTSLIMDGVNFVSLQKPRMPTGNFPISDWIDDIHDFAGTAALIESLDLVITVDTAVAHLAGALGKPVLNLVRFNGYWPWLAPDVAPNPVYSIWYPSMQLLRQQKLTRWTEAIEGATELLTHFIGLRSAA